MPRRTTQNSNSTGYSMPYKFGVEIECFGRIGKDALQSAIDNARGLGTWEVKYDGSVTGNGLEVISPPLAANNRSFKQVEKVCKILQDKGLKVDRSCGLHVHLSRGDGWTVGQVATIYRRYGHFEREIDEYHSQSRRRSVNQYCQSVNENRLTRANVGNHFNQFTIRDNDRLQNYNSVYLRRDATTALMRATNYDRYYKVNLQSLSLHGTIEFRQHAGTIDKDKIINWTKFLIEFCQKSVSMLETDSTTFNSNISINTPVSTAQMTSSARNCITRLCGNSFLLNAKQKAILKMIYDAGNDGIKLSTIKANLRMPGQHRSIAEGTIKSYISKIRRAIDRQHNWYSISEIKIIHNDSQNKYTIQYSSQRTRQAALRLQNQNINWVNFSGDELLAGINQQTIEFMKHRKHLLSNSIDSESVEPTEPTRRENRRAGRITPSAVAATHGQTALGCACTTCATASHR